MSARSRHLEEMRYAVANRCSLAEARDRLARLKWLASEAAREKRLAGAREGAESAPAPAAPIEYWWMRY